MTTRKVVTRRSRHVRGLMPSLKNACSIPWESQNELHYYRLLELSSGVRRYRVQPSVEVIRVHGADHFYFPDVEVEFVDGSVAIVEVKPELRLATAEVAARMAAAREAIVLSGRRFHIVTDSRLRVSPRLQNVEELMSHRRQLLLRGEELQELTRELRRAPPSSVRELHALCGERLANLALGLGIVGVDLDQPMTDSSPTYLGGHRHESVFT